MSPHLSIFAIWQLLTFLIMCTLPHIILSFPSNVTRRSLTSSVPPWISFSTLIGRVSSDEPVHVAIHFTWRDMEGLESYARQVSTPGSPLYGKYLTSADILSRHAPPEANVLVVRNWLTSHGFRVLHVPSSRKHIVAECTAKQVEEAFETTLDFYKFQGHTLRAPSSVPSIPLSLAEQGVTHIVGLDQGWRLKKRHSKKSLLKGFKKGTSGKNSTMCYFKLVKGGNSTAPKCGYRSSQLRKAYGVPSRLTGAGQSVAIVTAFSSPFMQNDLNIWARQVGINSTLLTQLSPEYTYSYQEALLNPAADYDPGWQGEEALDIETVRGIAPKASIFHVSSVSASDVDLIAAVTAVLDYGIASIISNSYGGPLHPTSVQPSSETMTQNQPWTEVLIQAAAQGVGVYFSSGDDGDESKSSTYDGKATTEYPASDPWAIAVGGTSLGITKNGTRAFEVYWGSLNTTDKSFVSGAGGGISQVYPLPFYQKTGPAKKFLDKYGKGKIGRVVPDFSGNADPSTGYFTGYSTIKLEYGSSDYNSEKYLQPVYDNYVFGGTSLSCPMIAAFVALTQEMTGRRFGFINPLLYTLPSSAFIDVVSPEVPIRALKSGDIMQFGETLSLTSSPGYDDSTGLGVPSPLFWSKMFWKSVPKTSVTENSK